MSTYDEFKDKDKSEKVTIVHAEPLSQVLRWTHVALERYSKVLSLLGGKTNVATVGLVRNGVDLLPYSSADFLEDGDGNPFLTEDIQFFKVDE